jgi:hypothetical protein
VDYNTAVGIANGNKRVAMCYAPLMLQGQARTWLNSLQAGSINSWPEFDQAFVHNFSTTYTHPGRPRQLAQCIQGKTESDNDYLQWWTALHNTCEEVLEVQAIQYFTDGCRDGIMLKHKLMRSKPSTMVELMATAEKYSTVDARMLKPIWVDAVGQLIPNSDKRQPASSQPATGNSHRDNRDKRKDEQLDSRYGSHHVIVVEEA